MAWADVNGVRMFFETHGPGDAPAIVFAHGAGGHHMSWWQQVPHFAGRFRCVTFDHRGFGQTDEVADGPGAASYPDDLRALLDHLQIDRAVLVGQSMGGITVMGFTGAWPERVRGLVMADTVLGIDDEAVATRMREIREARAEQPTLAAGAYHPSLRERSPAMAFLYDSIMATNPPRDMRRSLGASSEARFRPNRERLAAISVPMLFLAGEHDALIPAEVVKLASTLVPDARYEEVPGCGHSVYFEDATSFNRIVDDFIASLPA